MSANPFRPRPQFAREATTQTLRKATQTHGVEIRSLGDFINGALSMTSEVGMLIDEVQAAFYATPGTASGKHFTADQWLTISDLLERLTHRAVIAHEAVTDIQQVYYEGVR